MPVLTHPAPSGKPAVQGAPPNPVDDVLTRCSAALMPAGARYFLRSVLLAYHHRPAKRDGNDLRGLAAEMLEVAAGRDYWPKIVEVHGSYFDSIPLIQVDRLLRGTQASDMPADVRAVLYVLAGHANAERQAWPCRETLAGEAGLSVRRVDAVFVALAAKGWIKLEKRGGRKGRPGPSAARGGQRHRASSFAAALRGRMHRTTAM